MNWWTHARRLRREMALMRHFHGYWPNLLRPRTFNEHIARRKLRVPPPPEWTRMADKLAVREIVAARIGSQYLVPLVGVWQHADDVPPPKRPLIVKPSHASGLTSLIADPAAADMTALRAEWSRWLDTPFGVDTHEAWYDGIPRRLIGEQLLVDDTYGVPLDFKFLVFHGKADYIQVDYERFRTHTRTFYDREWRPQTWGQGVPVGPTTPRPAHLDEMLLLAECLSADLDFVRVDLYCVNDCDIYFGEFTLAPAAGWTRFSSPAADLLLGRCWRGR